MSGVCTAARSSCVHRYEVDETSPEESMVEALFEDEGYSYQILSKPIGPARVPEHTHCAHGCAHC